jgi:hypothetical protein
VTFSTWRPNVWVLTPEAMWINFKLISTWRPTSGFWKTYRLQSVHVLDYQSKHGELWFLLQVNNLNIFPKEMCQKSKMDTTIDFVKHPKRSRINIFLNISVPKIWNRGIITLVVRPIELDEKFKTNTSCLILRFSRKSNKSRVLSWLTGTKTSVVGKKKKTNYFIDLSLSVRT